LEQEERIHQHEGLVLAFEQLGTLVHDVAHEGVLVLVLVDSVAEAEAGCDGLQQFQFGFGFHHVLFLNRQHVAGQLLH